MAEGKVDFVKEMRMLHLVSLTLEKIAQGSEVAEIMNTVNELNQRFRRCQQILNDLPSGDLTKDEQIDLLTKLNERLKRTRELVQKYQTLDVFQKLEQGNGPASLET